MATNVQKPIPIPPPEVPFIDVKTGKISRDWYEYLRSVDRAFRALLQELA